MKRFIHIIPYAHLGGTEKDCYYIINQLKDDRHHVLVLDREGPMSEKWKESGGIVEHLDILKVNIFRFYYRLKNFKLDCDPDGIFYWSTIRLPLVRSALNNYSRRMAVHVGNPVEKSFRKIIKDLMLHWILPKGTTTRLFPCSGHVNQTLKSHLYYRLFNSTISLNPVEVPETNPYSHLPISTLALQNSRRGGETPHFRLGMVARMDPIKDHETVIKAFTIILMQYPVAVLELVGDGPLRSRLETLVKNLEIENSVHFLGMQPEVYPILQSWDLFLYATTEREGLGNALSEALANGLPSVASDLPMLREIDGASEAVCFVPAGNAESMAEKAIELLQDSDKRKVLSQRAYQRAKQAFSAKRYAMDRLSFLLGNE